MSYNTDHLHTAGKITVWTTLAGLAVFVVAFVFNIGESQIRQAVADSPESATTSVTVVNTAPLWTASTTEVIESSTTSPTNSGDVVRWTAVGTDSNGEDYYLLICSNTNAPTATISGAPTCNGGIQWAVSPAASSGVAAVAATTTTEAFAESNVWTGWICDGNSGTPRCNANYTQGLNATNSSPFEVNHRPLFSIFTDDSPKLPGQVVTFYSTSSDTDVSGSPDTVKLIVCATAGFSTTTDTCTGTLLASSTVYVSAHASATYTVVIPSQDTNFGAYGYVIDNHGHESLGAASGTNSILTVDNAAPTVASSSISLAQTGTTSDMILTVEQGQTTGFQLQFTVTDNNSCDAFGGGAADEITGYDLSIYRSGITQTGCTPTSTINANNCYPSTVPTTTWNLSCTASSTSCTGASDPDVVFNCTFPLWYVADPTDGTATSTQYSAQNWVAQVQGIDDDVASGTLTQSQSGVEVTSFLAFALNTLTIPYGSLEPGQQTDPLNATTTIAATGNVGVDKDVTGTAMCTTYTGSTLCPNSATSTIPAEQQRFGTSTVAFSNATAISSTTPTLVQIHVPKSTSTSTPTTSSAYWGIAVPGSITFAGDYSGQNTFTARVSTSTFW